jgi:hypothetical protein
VAALFPDGRIQTFDMNYGLTRKNGINTCMTYCVARYFSIPPRQVPFFIGNANWRDRFERFFRRRKKKIELYYFNKRTLPKRGYCFVVGLSPASKAKTNNPHDARNKHHMVLYKDGRLFFDPNHCKRALKGRPHYVWRITSLRPKKMAASRSAT